ncbi:MAG: flagellar biosynthesis protein FlhB [Bdellovibrionales bacterium]|nr:flagellar biosynthesis protein FlhB [Bdellovibrionales bacterium]
MGAESESGAEKSEEPTAKRLSEARREGQVAKSNDLSQVVGLTAAFMALWMIAPSMWHDLEIVFRGGLSGKHSGGTLSIPKLQKEFLGLLLLLLPKILVLFLIAALGGAGTMAFQTKFLWSTKLLRPKFSNLNPIKGIKRLFSMQNAVNLLKSIFKLAIICPIAYFAFFDVFPGFLALMHAPIAQFLPYSGEAASVVFWRIVPLLFVLALADFAYQKWNTHRTLKMTKEEVKDERKALEGDEKTKMQIRQKALQRARERMMQDVRTADVVVTNPTHIAVALKYDLAPGSAPTVVAKGRGYVAERIKTIAKENKVPVLERKALARALFKAVEVGQNIPYELFTAVAELLAYVYRLRGNNPFAKKKRSVS